MFRISSFRSFNSTLRLGVVLAAAAVTVLPIYADTHDENVQSLAAENQKKVLQIAEQIRKNIVTLPNYGVFDDLKFTIQGGEVTLMGYASRPTLKSSAEKVVRSVEGVDSVVNKIEVLPLSRFDDQIRLKTYVAIYMNPNLRKYSSGRPFMPMLTPLWANGGITNNPPTGWNPIHIIVKNGNVTLTGVVDRDMDKQIIGMAANRVPGVFSVANDLAVVAPNQAKAKPAQS
ncbi:MAG: BON domain-containing protein [Bryobacteraceae bacterium]